MLQILRFYPIIQQMQVVALGTDCLVEVGINKSHLPGGCLTEFGWILSVLQLLTFSSMSRKKTHR